MHNPENESKLIVIDIARAMIDYVNIQMDVDEHKIQAASLLAQRIDLKNRIGKENVERCYESNSAPTPEDTELRELIIPPLCYYTMCRLLKTFPGVWTDSGYVIEEGASDKNVTQRQANEFQAIADELMSEVFDFLKAEDPQDQTIVEGKSQSTPGIRVFGGQEAREYSQSPQR